LLDIQVKAVSAGNAYLDAQLAADQAVKKMQDMVDQLELTKNELSKEEAYLKGLQSSLTILAPIKGHFKVLVASGSFVKQGHILGEIET
jgi:biotin carboxyl carrier protein